MPKTRTEAAGELARLRWGADMVVLSPTYNERYWMKEMFDVRGIRRGITDCCPENDPCEWHKALGERTIT